MPEKQPLQTLRPLQLILKPKLVFLVKLLQQIQQLRRGLHNRKRRLLSIIDEDGNPTVGIQAEEPLFLLLVGGDVDQRRRPLGAVGIRKLFEEDLDFLAVGSGGKKKKVSNSIERIF